VHTTTELLVLAECFKRTCCSAQTFNDLTVRASLYQRATKAVWRTELVSCCTARYLAAYRSRRRHEADDPLPRFHRQAHSGRDIIGTPRMTEGSRDVPTIGLY